MALSDTEASVLISLADRSRHGTAILADIEAATGRRPAVGTLYGVLDRLIADGLVEPVEASGRRRPYRLTDAGRSALGGYLAEAEARVSLARRRLALG